ncbi:HEAT repeat domain-containing protein [Gemmatimonadota bacterium]
MLKIKLSGMMLLLCSTMIFLGNCEVKPPAEGARLSEVEKLYDQGNYKDAMNVARYNLKNKPKDPASVITVWKVQVMQGTKSKDYTTEFFKVARERVVDFGNDLIPYLGRGLTSDASNPVRLFCLLCLGELADNASSEQICKVFDPGYAIGNKTSDITLEDLRSEAALILSMRRYNQAFDGIAAMAESQNPETRVVAAMALGYLGDKRALPILEELSKDRDVDVLADSAIARINRE